MDKFEIRELTLNQLKDALTISEYEIKACKDENMKGKTKWLIQPAPKI